MEGAFIVAEKGGVKITGRVDHIRTPPDFIRIGYGEWEFRLADPGWTITVTAPKPKPVDPTGGDPVVLAHGSNPSNPSNPDYRRVYFRAEDGTWSSVRGSLTGMWPTERLYDIERLSAQTIAELMSCSLRCAS